jgi:septal ring factor EnvC (AmiA/AmiB activator)
MRKWKQILFGGIVIGGIFALGTIDLWAGRTDQIEKDITQKQKDLKETKRELSLTKEKEKKILGKESSILESLNLIETELHKKERELKKMEAQLAQTEERLDQTKNQVTMLNQGMERTKEEFFSRLTALYKMGRVPLENLLLTSQSYLDLLRIDKYLRVIIDFDARLVDTYRHQVALKERYQEDLIRDQSQWQRNIFEVEKKRGEFKKVRETKRALLRAIRNQKVVYHKLIGELERGNSKHSLIDWTGRKVFLLMGRRIMILSRES